MSKKTQIKEEMEFIQKGIHKLGRNRAVALSSHKAWELTDELEQRIIQAIKLLESS